MHLGNDLFDLRNNFVGYRNDRYKYTRYIPVMHLPTGLLLLCCTQSDLCVRSVNNFHFEYKNITRISDR